MYENRVEYNRKYNTSHYVSVIKRNNPKTLRVLKNDSPKMHYIFKNKIQYEFSSKQHFLSNNMIMAYGMDRTLYSNGNDNYVMMTRCWNKMAFWAFTHQWT